MDDALRSRLNRLNGSTLLGIGLARLGRASVRPGPRRLLLAEGHRLPGRAVAFAVGDVLFHRRVGGFERRPALLRHEARHAEQYAWCGGLPFLPLYAASAALSWALAGDRAGLNPFERHAGLADGGYRERGTRGTYRALRPSPHSPRRAETP